MSRGEQAALLSSRYLLVGDNDKDHYIANIYALARSITKEFDTRYGFVRKPELFVVDKPGLEAFATRTSIGYAAVIPTGIYDFALEELHKYFGIHEEVNIFGIMIPQVMLADIFFLFVAFHEYVHVANGHIDYLLNQSNTIENSEYKALEYDADCMATIMVYRVMQILLKNPPEDVLMPILYAGIYWPLRVLENLSSLTGRSPSRHPSFAARLSICSSKIISINNITLDGMPANEELTLKRIDTNLKVFLEQEKIYANVNNLPSSNNFIVDIYTTDSPVQKEAALCARDWWIIKDNVNQVNSTGIDLDARRLDWKFEEGRFSFNWHG